MCADFVPTSGTPSDVPDVLGANLDAVFCGINPGRISAEAGAHFANPRNDFWRLLHDAGFTPRLLAPEEQFELLRFGYGLTNAAYRTTKGSGDLRRDDFAGSADRLARLAYDLRPRALAFVGKEAYRGVFGERPDLGLQSRGFGDTAFFVLPSTSPANAAVPYAERLRWFRALRDWLSTEPLDRPAVRALVVDESGRTLLLRYVNPYTQGTFWTTPGGGVEPGESEEDTLRRELVEELGLRDAELGPWIWSREFVFPWGEQWVHQRERYRLLRVHADDLAALSTDHLRGEDVHEHRWWTADELEQASDEISPRRLPALLRELLAKGPPPEPFDVGV